MINVTAPNLSAQKIAVLLPQTGAEQDYSGARVYRSLAELIASVTPLLGLYAPGWTASEYAEIAAAWLASPHWFRPAFVGPDESVPFLFDGAASFEHAIKACEHTEALRQSLQLDPQTLHFDERLMYFLYLREPYDLEPVCDRSSKLLYRYPLAQAIAPDQDDIGAWLASLARRNLLQPGKLIDRTRHCRRCTSAHQHFLDVCPHCSSIEIRPGASLHCFTCGHVAPEEDFHGDGVLTCPRCSTRLRHIGVDYDRPLTKFACASCHHTFIEASVVARCLDCGNVAEPDALDVREVTSLRLTAQGRAALRAGQLSESFAALETANYVVPNYFRLMLDWALSTSTRHQQFTFSLVMIEFLNASEVIESQGATRIFMMLDELARRMRELLRKTDITTRTNEQVLWVFLPFSSGAGFAERVKSLLAEAVPDQGKLRLEARIRNFETPADAQPETTASGLMDRLQQVDEA